MFNVTAPVQNGAAVLESFELIGNEPVSNLPAILVNLPDDVRAAILSNAPTAGSVMLAATGGTKNRPVTRSFGITFGQPDEWTPVRTAESTHRIGSAARKLTEFDEMLTAALAVRGGTVLYVPFSYKHDSMGFPQPDYSKTVRGLEAARTRIVKLDDRKRAVSDLLVMANDQNADDASTVAGYVLLRITGYRVK